MICCFFGHRDTPDSINLALRSTLEDLITTEGVTNFLVGNQGNFDSLVLRTLRELQQVYPQICYHVVLAYLPTGKGEYTPYTQEETILPEGIEQVHPRYAISRRNRWMVQQADMMVCYITHNHGGAAQFVEMARRRGKHIINILARL